MKNYNVSIGESNFTIKARNLFEAKQLALANKRLERLKGVTVVRLKKD